MKQELIINRIQELTQEVESLTLEKQQLNSRYSEIEVRLHQLIGAIYEMQRLINLENQPDSEKASLPSVDQK
jgi:hypothetical protein